MKCSYVNLFVIIFFTSIHSYNNYALATSDDDLSKVKRFQSQLEAIDNANQKYNKSFYQQMIKAPAIRAARFTDIESLNQVIQSEIQQENTIKAIALTLRNKNLLKRFYDDPAVVGLLKLLLDTNNFTSADSLINEMKSYGDDNLNEQLNYLLAGFYFQRKDWVTVLKLISADTSNLPSSQHNHLMDEKMALGNKNHFGQIPSVYFHINKPENMKLRNHCYEDETGSQDPKFPILVEFNFGTLYAQESSEKIGSAIKNGIILHWPKPSTQIERADIHRW
jgi:uncharacterized pyridoxamine 5'-phosphate oxidase family protein